MLEPKLGKFVSKLKLELLKKLIFLELELHKTRSFQPVWNSNSRNVKILKTKYLVRVYIWPHIGKAKIHSRTRNPLRCSKFCELTWFQPMDFTNIQFVLIQFSMKLKLLSAAGTCCHVLVRTYQHVPSHTGMSQHVPAHINRMLECTLLHKSWPIWNESCEL